MHCVCQQTTRNIQEGLPFTIEDVRRQTEDTNLLAAVHDVADKYDGTGHYCRDRSEYNLLMRFLVSVVVFGHFQRPSVATNLTIEEFVRAKTASDGRVVVLVSDHKTGAQGPAQIALEPAHYKLFQLYTKRSVTIHSHVTCCYKLLVSCYDETLHYQQIDILF